MKNGIFYIVFNFVIEKLRFLSLVELFKYIGSKANPNSQDINSRLTYSRNSVDLFVLLKWSFVLVIFCAGCHSIALTICVWYLIVTNIYTFFYYHIWLDLDNSTNNIERTRRRFLSLMFAIGFSDLCFAYFYANPFVSEFSWRVNQPRFLQSVWYSISNSLAANYEVVNPLTDTGDTLSMIQLIITFIFITIILGKSIP